MSKAGDLDLPPQPSPDEGSSSPPSLQPSRLTQRREIIISFCLVILVAISFSLGVFCGFVDFDDNIYVTDNPVVQQGLNFESFR